MTFEEIIKTMLPDIIWEFDDIYLKLDKIAMEKSGANFERKVKKGTEFKVTFDKEKNGFGISREEDKTKKFHTGVDLSYGKDCAFNFIHPRVYSPVYGEIVMLEDSDTEKLIGIESFGYLHIFEHFHSIDNYKLGDFVGIGSLLGQMGGTGETGLYHYEQHLHYEIRMSVEDYDGIIEFDTEKLNIELLKKEYIALNPLAFWDNGREFGQYFSEKKGFYEKESNLASEKEVNFHIINTWEMTDINNKNYKMGKIMYKDLEWEILEKGNAPHYISSTYLAHINYQENPSIQNKTHHNRHKNMHKAEKEAKAKLREYGINDGDFTLCIRENHIEISIDKNNYSKIMIAKSSKEFGEFNNIFICNSIEIKRDNDGEIEEFTLIDSEKAFKELKDALIKGEDNGRK